MINRDKDIAINIYLIQEIRKSEWWVKFVSNHSHLGKKVDLSTGKEVYGRRFICSDFTIQWLKIIANIWGNPKG